MSEVNNLQETVSTGVEFDSSLSWYPHGPAYEQFVDIMNLDEPPAVRIIGS